MLIYYDTTRDNQVMAFYTGGSNSTVWAAKGYTALEVRNDSFLARQVAAAGRDCRLVFNSGNDTVVLSPHPDNRIE